MSFFELAPGPLAAMISANNGLKVGKPKDSVAGGEPSVRFEP